MKFAKSLSGHDKDHIYYIIEEKSDFLYLVNGTTRPLEKAKKKNGKHVQIIKKLPKEVEMILEAEQTNETIKRAISTYEKLIRKNEEEC